MSRIKEMAGQYDKRPQVIRAQAAEERKVIADRADSWVREVMVSLSMKRPWQSGL